jgi:hypothetical protein
VPQTADLETVSTLETLLEAARIGEVTGLAIVVALRGKEFFFDVAGALERDLIFARGAARGLDDYLGDVAEARGVTP